MASELLSQMMFGNTLTQYGMALVIVLASIILGKIVYYFINNHLKKFTKKTKTELDDHLIRAVEGPIVLLIIAFGISLSLMTLNVPGSLIGFSTGITTALFVIAIIWMLNRIIDILFKEYITPYTKKTKSSLDEQLVPAARKGIKSIVIIMGLLILISNFGIDITALVAGLGIGGLALALASKDTVENLFGAFAIFMDRPFRINDRVILDGVTGEVMEVGLRSTRIKTLDNTELYIPNARVAQSNIENISRPNRHLARSFLLGVKYDTTLAKVQEGIEIIKELLPQTEGVSDKYVPTVVFREFAASSLNIYVKFWVNDYKKRNQIVDRVNQRIKEMFEAADIEFAYPTQTIHLEKDD